MIIRANEVKNEIYYEVDNEYENKYQTIKLNKSNKNLKIKRIVDLFPHFY